MSGRVRLTRAERASVGEIGHALSTVEENGRTGVFDHLMPAVRTLLGMEQSALFLFEQSNGTVGVDRLYIDGSALAASEARAIADAHFRSTRVWALYDPKNPEAEQQNLPMVVGGTLEALTENGSAVNRRSTASSRLGIESDELEARLEAFDRTERALLGPIGWSGRKQLRALLCDHSALVGWLGGTADDFGAREKFILGLLVPAFLARIRLDKRLEQGALAAVGLAAALEAIASPAFVISMNGIVQHANAIGRAALEAGPETAARLRELASGSTLPNDVTIAPLSSPGLPPHLLVMTRSRAADVERTLHSAAVRWGLTAREVDVLRELIGGAANKEIGATLGCSYRTVEIHVTHLLAKAGCSSRLALTARVWTGV